MLLLVLGERTCVDSEYACPGVGRSDKSHVGHKAMRLHRRHKNVPLVLGAANTGGTEEKLGKGKLMRPAAGRPDR